MAQGDWAENLAREAVRMALLTYRPLMPRQGQCQWCLGRDGQGSCCTKRLGMDLKETLTVKAVRLFWPSG
ncbi:MAG: hypothetical protein CM15mP68_3270 [Pseudomonadota bacterium]|nr:MAG: hypothetical protein CM15mP68_3270 [Pseudomonadota bacterium]